MKAEYRILAPKKLFSLPIVSIDLFILFLASRLFCWIRSRIRKRIRFFLLLFILKS